MQHPPHGSRTAGSEGDEPLADNRLRRMLLIPHEAWLLQGDQRERAVMLDGGGRVLLQKEGEADRVLWRWSELAPLVNRVYLVTHNHPRGTSLTPEDLELARIVGAVEVDAVTPAVRHRLYRLTEQWPSASELRGAIDEEEASLVTEMEDQLREGTITVRQAELLYYRVLWTRVAGRFPDRLRYVQERRTT
jgi:hypothetical protein